MIINHYCGSCGGELVTDLSAQAVREVRADKAGWYITCGWCSKKKMIDRAWLRRECEIAFFRWEIELECS